MTATAAPFGFRPAYSPIGLIRAKKYAIAGGYATGIQSGSTVALTATGTIIAGPLTGDLLGIFAGCEYTDPTGKPVVSNQWPAGQLILAGTTVTAWVYDDYTAVFEVQGVGSIAQVNIGEEADTAVNTGSTFTGLSAASLAAPGGVVQGQWRIVGFGQGVDNAPGDAFTIVQVTLAQSQVAFANKVGV